MMLHTNSQFVKMIYIMKLFRLVLLFLCIPSFSRADQWRTFKYGDSIKCMIAADHAVWIGGESGALLYDVEKDSFLRVTKEINGRGESLQLAGAIVRDIAVDPRGRVWFACWDRTREGLTGAGITVMDAIGFTSFEESGMLPSNEVYALCADPQGRIWAGTGKGVAVFDENQWTIFTTDDGLYRNDAVEIAVGPNGRVWCGFWRGVNAFYDDHWWRWERKRVDYVYSILPGNDNRIYCATKGGLAIYDGERWEFALNRGDLRKRLISDMTQDQNGHIWCAWGGLEKGISVFDGSEWSQLTHRNTNRGLANDRAIAVASDRYNRIWIGDRDGAVSILIPDGAPDVAVRAMNRQNPSHGLTRGFKNYDSQIDERSKIAISVDKRVSQERYIAAAISQHQENEQEQQNEEPSAPVLPAPAGDATVQFKITTPIELESSTAAAPFTTNQKLLEITGGIAATNTQLAKIEVNGFEAKLKPAVDFGFGGPPIYPFEATVLLNNIEFIHIEAFDKNDRSQGFRNYPLQLQGPSKETTKPSIRFIKPVVTDEELVAVRSGGGPIEVKMTSANKGIVRGLVQDDSGVENVLFNGQEVEYLVEASPTHLEEGGMSGGKNVKFFEHRFALAPGNNRFRLQIVDIFNNVMEIPMDVRVQKALADSMFYDRNYALVVGIDDYQRWRPLANAVRDAKGIRELLRNRFHFPPDNIYELYNEDATLDGIRSAFGAIAKADHDSRIVIFFAGHGQTMTTRDRPKEGFLIPSDGAMPDARTSMSDAAASWLSMKAITELISQSKAKHILLVLDACYSGLLTAKRSAVFGDFREVGEEIGFGEENALTADFLRLSALEAVEVITAGAENEEALDGGPGGHSYFTGLLIEGIQSGEADLSKDGVVTSEELGSFLSYQVQLATSGRQHPAYSKLPGFEEERGLVLFSLAGQDTILTSMLPR